MITLKIPSTTEEIEHETILLSNPMLYHCHMEFLKEYTEVFGKEDGHELRIRLNLEPSPVSPWQTAYVNMFDDAKHHGNRPNKVLLRFYMGDTLYNQIFQNGIERALENASQGKNSVLNMSRYDAASALLRNTERHTLQFTDLSNYFAGITFVTNTIFFWLSKYDALEPVLHMYSKFFEQGRHTINKHYARDVRTSSALEVAMRTDLVLTSRDAIAHVASHYDTSTPWSWRAPLIADNIAQRVADPTTMENFLTHFLQRLEENLHRTEPRNENASNDTGMSIL